MERRVPFGHDGGEWRGISRRGDTLLRLQSTAEEPQLQRLRSETDTRMVNEQRGVLCRITASKPSPQLLQTTLTVRVPGVLQTDGVGVENSTQRTRSISFVRPSRKPDAVSVDKNSVVWTWNLQLPAGGSANLGFVAGDDGKAPLAGHR